PLALAGAIASFGPGTRPCPPPGGPSPAGAPARPLAARRSRADSGGSSARAARMSASMRVAFSGAHQVGKSTLLEAVAAARPRYAVIVEPYRVLEDEGHDFSDPPTLDDFERQLERSLELVRDAPPDALLD